MRTIKFRAWDKEYENMFHNAYPFEHLVYVEMFDDDETFQRYKHKMMVVNRKYFYFIIAKDIDLMQFTGVLDKNEKEIYEGDICRLEKAVYKVYWNDDRWGLEGAKGWDYDSGDYYRGDDINNWDEFEIIGNLYQNPELMHT